MSEDERDSDQQATDAPSADGALDPQSIEAIFLAALAKENPDERRAFLDESCSDDDQRRRVDALLRAYHDAGSFLEDPAVGRHAVPETLSTDEILTDFLEPTDASGYLGTVGPYQVIETIGRGGMGIVLRALDPKLNRIVAIKVLTPELASTANARRRFLREAQAAAAVSHPHVVTIHAVDEARLPYLVMECIVGQSLQDKLDQVGSLELKEILRIGRQIAEGLQAAHEQGLVHRDIKPANILLENGVQRVKITDFGLARAADDATITRTGEVAGTPHYMSPEQACGESVSHRSDLFSLGSVLYAMCTGRPPFRGDTLAGVIKRVLDDTPRPIAELAPETPQWLIDVIDQLLEKDPNQRFESAAEVADILATHLAGPQVPVTRRPASRTNGAPPSARTKWLLALSLSFAAGIVIGTFRGISDLTMFWAVLAGVLFAWFGIHRCRLEGRQPWLNLKYADLHFGAGALLLGLLAMGNFDKALSTFAGWGTAFLGIALFQFLWPEPIRPGGRPQSDSTDGIDRRSFRWGILSLVSLALLPVVLLVITALMPLLASRRTGVVTVVCDPTWQVVELESPNGTTAVDEEPIELILPPGRHQLTAIYEDAGERYEITEVVMLPPGEKLQVDFGSAIVRDKARRSADEAGESSLPTPVIEVTPAAEAPDGTKSAKALQQPYVARVSADSLVGSARMQESPLPQGVSWEEHADASERTDDKAELNLQIQDEGLLVTLQISNPLDNDTSSREFTAADVGTVTFAVPPGKYELAIRDEHFGWGGEQLGSVVIRDSGSATLTVKRSLAASLEPLTEIESLDAESGQPPELRFLWNGARYELTPGQASAVQVLAAAVLAQQPDVAESDIVSSIHSPWLRGKTLEENFQFDDQLVTAWGKLVVPGGIPGTYRLASLQTDAPSTDEN